MSAREMNPAPARAVTMAGAAPVEHLLLGPAGHGVTRHGAELAGPWRTTIEDVGPHASALAQVLADAAAGPVHIHLTEALLGNGSARDEHAAIEEGVAVLEASRRPVHLTLHDVPQPAEGEARYGRRAALYARLVAAAASVQVCSEAERVMLGEAVGRSVDSFGVVSLPVDLRDVASNAAAAVARLADDAPVGVLGFVHPGKDPGLALDVAAASGRDLVLLGRVVEGHEEFAADLQRDARARGVDVRVLGHLSEDEMDAAIATVAVPLAPYRHISASGSIGRWIASGRRPIALATPWVRELDERSPGVVTVVEAQGESSSGAGGDLHVAGGDVVLPRLVAAARHALADPSSTVIIGRPDGLLTTPEAASRQAQLLALAIGEAR